MKAGSRQLVRHRFDGHHLQRLGALLLKPAADRLVVAHREVRRLDEGPGQVPVAALGVAAALLLAVGLAPAVHRACIRREVPGVGKPRHVAGLQRDGHGQRLADARHGVQRLVVRPRPGLCQEILNAVEKQDPGLRFTGLDQQVPLKRVERLLADGLIDAFFCLLRSPEREKQWRYVPVPLYAIRHVVVQRADDVRSLDTLADLAVLSRRKPVLVMRGTALARRLLAADVAIAEVGSEREALQMLTMGRADAIYGQDINLLHHMAEARLGERLKIGRTVFQEEPQYLAVRADLPAAHEERLTQALRKLDRDGVLRALAEKYR